MLTRFSLPRLPSRFPSPREIFLACFVHAGSTLLPLPLLVRAYLMTFFDLGKTIQEAWAALEEAEIEGAVCRKLSSWRLVPAADLILCPVPWELPEDDERVFAEVELLLRLEDARDELAEPDEPVTEEFRAPMAIAC